jgi:hypothetical protein
MQHRKEPEIISLEDSSEDQNPSQPSKKAEENPEGGLSQNMKKLTVQPLQNVYPNLPESNVVS